MNSNLALKPRRPGGLLRITADENAALVDIRNSLTTLQAKFAERESAIKTLTEKAEAELRDVKSISTETKAALASAATAGTQLGEQAGRLLALEQKIASLVVAGNDNKAQSIGAKFVADAKVKAYLEARGRGRVSFVTNAITSLTTGDGGFGDAIVPQRVPGWIEQRFRRLRIRDLLSVGQTSSNAIEFIQETGFTNNAAPVAEGAVKPESSLAIELQTAPIRTIAHVMKASVQILQDVPQLRSFIDTRLRIGLALVEEDQFLSGDGTGQNILGLIPQATAYDTARDQAGDTRIDKIRRAMTQLELALYPAEAIVLHPVDWESIELLKDAEQRYIWANPRGMLAPTIWGLPVLTSMALEEGEFLIGAFSLAAQIWDRQDAVVEASTEDEDNFRRNMVTIRAEERVGLTVYRPESFIYGDFDVIVSS